MGPSLDRRSFLVWCAGLGVACGSRRAGAPPPSIVGDRLDAVAMFHVDRVIAAGMPQRLPVALWGTPGLVADGEELGVEVRFEDELLETTTVIGHTAPHDHVDEPVGHQHSDQLRYYPLRVTLPEPGIYDLTVLAAGQRIAFPVQAFDPADVSVVQAGERMPAIETPTYSEAQGVDPICTLHDGPCPLHRTTPNEAIGQGRPFVLLVGSPAYCSNAFCASSLRLLIDVAESYPNIAFIHAEPYGSPRQTGTDDPVNADRAPVMNALGLGFEPALFVVDGGGTVVERFDAVLSNAELSDALSRI